MTPPYFPSPGDGHASHRRPSREIISQQSHESCMSLTIPASARSSPRASCSSGRQRSRVSPSEESPQESGIGAQRRRIAVACGRCRKRKIRCSGDPGDGSGCNNCKTSGTDPSQCQFLRVNSVDCPGSAYPYSAALTAAANSRLNECDPYPTSSASSGNIIGSMSVPGTLPYNPLPSAQSYPVLPSRPVGSSSFATSSGDEIMDTFHAVPTQLMLPSQEPLSNCSLFGSNDSSRLWGSVGQPAKHASGVYMENSHYGNPQMPLMSSMGTRLGQTNGESPPFFTGLSSLTASLPLPPSAGERILPRPHPYQAGAGSSNAGEPLSYSSWDSLPPKQLSHDWGVEAALLQSNDDQDSRRPSSDSASTTFGAATTTSKSPMRSSQDSSLSYISRPTEAGHHESTGAATSYAQASSAASTAQNSYPSSELAGFSAAATNDSVFRGHISSDLYSFSAGSSFKHGPHGSRSGPPEGTLVSGRAYTRLQQTQPPPPNPLASLRRDSREAHAKTPHRPSVGGFRA